MIQFRLTDRVRAFVGRIRDEEFVKKRAVREQLPEIEWGGEFATRRTNSPDTEGIAGDGTLDADRVQFGQILQRQHHHRILYNICR
jgi:hypothetical protein